MFECFVTAISFGHPINRYCGEITQKIIESNTHHCTIYFDSKQTNEKMADALVTFIRAEICIDNLTCVCFATGIDDIQMVHRHR